MAQAALVHDTLLPQPAGGNAVGAALALVVHAGLLVALTVSVDWRTRTPETVSAELWSSVPQIAAPRAVEPTPAPPPPAPVPAPPPPPPPAVQPQRDADIATERAERKKAEDERKKAEATAEAERQRAEAEKKKRELAQKNEQAAKEAKAAEERLALQREENLRRMMGQAGTAAGGTAVAGTGTAARDAAPSASYAGRIIAAVRPKITFTGAVADEAITEVEVTATASGTIISVRLKKASGHKDWDDAVLRAIDKLGRLPADTDGRVPSSLLLVFKPRE